MLLPVLWEFVARLLWQPSVALPAPATRATRAALTATLQVADIQGRLHDGRQPSLAPIHAPWICPPR